MSKEEYRMSARIEFRCSVEERSKVEERAGREGLSTGQFLLNHSIYKRGRRRLKAEERACLCKMRTYLNKISDGVDEIENTQKVLEECGKICQFLK